LFTWEASDGVDVPAYVYTVGAVTKLAVRSDEPSASSSEPFLRLPSIVGSGPVRLLVYGGIAKGGRRSTGGIEGAEEAKVLAEP